MPLIVYCTAALTSLSDSVSYITFLFPEWRILWIVGTVTLALVIKTWGGELRSEQSKLK